LETFDGDGFRSVAGTAMLALLGFGLAWISVARRKRNQARAA
jgi:hypothetical protein